MVQHQPYKITHGTPLQVPGELGATLPQSTPPRCTCGREMSRVAIDLGYQVWDCLDCDRVIIIAGKVARWYTRERR